ncbi:Apextrin [Plakobranchus ocellatus]|uniref:Apextrin n=1 Tax=Plakobranchus ocellatus TaxID=259542 RepID=A0AAV4BL42_9GAST|nr:Apextrin [Plakobranchus ocellatus]
MEASGKIAKVTFVLLVCLVVSAVEARVNIDLQLDPMTLTTKVNLTRDYSVSCSVTEQRDRYSRYPRGFSSVLTRLRILMEKKGSSWQPLAQVTNMEPNDVYVDPAWPNTTADGRITTDITSQRSYLKLSWNGPTIDAVNNFRCDAVTFEFGYKNKGRYDWSDKRMKTDKLNSYSFAALSALERVDAISRLNSSASKAEEKEANMEDSLRKERAEIEKLLSRIKTRLAEAVSSHAATIDTTARRLSDGFIEASEKQTREIDRVESMLNTALEGSLLMLWPRGSYGLPKPATGCPFTTRSRWQAGERRHHTESIDRNKDAVSPGNHLEQPVLYRIWDKNFVFQRFCMRTLDVSFGPDWPKGSYCINKYSDCPEGFSWGTVKWQEENFRSDSTKTGKLPSGRYQSGKTELYYCCREDGLPDDPVDLPRFQPFYLYRRGGRCQQVAGMKVTEEFIRFDTENRYNGDQASGKHPDVELDNLVLHLCYYEQAMVSNSRM